LSVRQIFTIILAKLGFLDGTDEENSKSRGKGHIRKIQKNKKERMDEKRRRDLLHMWRFPYFVCSPSVRDTLGLPPSCDPTSGEPTLMGTSPTTLHLSIIPF
jgi:hypothetical protein